MDQFDETEEWWVEGHITIRTLVERVKKHREQEEVLGPYNIESFLSGSLLPYYSCEFENWKCDKDVYDLIYRLGERLDPERRSRILVFPSSTGSILDLDGDRIVQWDSLQDWMNEWKRNHSPIKEFQSLLQSPDEQILLTH